MIYLLFLLILCPITVNAKDLYLDTLEIKNGTLSINYDKYNTKYTVEIAKYVEALEIEYSADKEYTVVIKDNHDLQNNSIVTISLTNDVDEVNYELQILKEEEEVVPTFNEIEPEDNNFMYTHKVYIIPLTIIFLIFILFKIFFPKHKK